MGLEPKTGFLGLVTNTSDLQAPSGALERANNVVIRRAGAIETRPGVSLLATKTNSTRAIKLIPYEAETVMALVDETWWNYAGDALIRYPKPDHTTVVDPPQFRRDLLPHAQTRGNLYVGTAIGVLKFTGVPDAYTGSDMFITTGVPLVFSMSATTYATPGFLANNYQVGYSLIGVKKDSNGLETRSRPTGMVIYANTSGSSQDLFLSLNTPFPTRLFDYVEIYRTRQFPTTVTPDAELALVGIEYGGSFVDSVADVDRGTALYTSPSREGAEGANDRPPACGALAVFKGALFCGNTVGPSRLVVSYSTTDSNLSAIATGIGFRIYNGTRTIATNTLTGMASTVGLKKGMIVSSGFPAGTYVTNIVGATVTVSANATSSSGGAVAHSFEDAISFDGGTTWIAIDTFNDSGGAENGRVGDLVTYFVTPPVGGFTHTLVIETALPGEGATLAIKATHGDEYVGAVADYDSTATAGTQDTYKHGLSWSKPDEPEHFPPKNFAFVGDKKREILALVSTRDALFIFKEDGVWRLTGIDGQYRIDPFDLTTRCVLPSSVVALRNKIYALTNHGVVAVSDAGVEIVSQAIGDQLKQLIYDLTTEGATGNGYVIGASNGVSIIGYAGAGCDRDHEYMLIVEDSLDDQRSGIDNAILVYNADTRAWTSWTFGRTGTYQCVPCSIAWNERDGRLVISQQTDAGRVFALAEPGKLTNFSEKYSSDADIAITISGVAGSTITYSPAIDMIAGDVVRTASDSTFRTVVTPLTSTTATLDSAAPTGSARYLRPIIATVRPRAFISPNRVMKLWTQFLAEFSEAYGLTSMAFSALSSIVTGSSTLVETPLPLSTTLGVSRYNMGAAIRGWHHSQSARGWKLLCELTWKSVFGSAVLEEIAVESREGKTNAPNLAVKP